MFSDKGTGRCKVKALGPDAVCSLECMETSMEVRWDLIGNERAMGDDCGEHGWVEDRSRKGRG